MSLDYFRRGRGLIILVALATVLLIGAIVVASSAIGRVLLVCAVVVVFVFAVMSIKTAPGNLQGSPRAGPACCEGTHVIADSGPV